MKNVITTVKEKLSNLGYTDNIINQVLGRFDLRGMEDKYYSFVPEDIVTVSEYNEPCIEIIQLLLNTEYNLIQSEVLEGDISLSSTESAIGTRFAIADYTLSKKNAVIALTNDYKIRIVIYRPTPKNQNIYNGITYEQNFKKDRDDITREYYEAYVESGKVSERKLKEIFTMLVSDFVIDEIAVNDYNPKFKIYDNEYKYAENLYSYSLRYINLKTNRLEIFEKEANVKKKSKNVRLGFVSNDPYIKIDKLPPSVDFPLNTISYYWFLPNKFSQGEIALFVPVKIYEKPMFSDLQGEDPRIEEVAINLAKRFRRETNIEIEPSDIMLVLKKLNPELIVPSTDIIRANLSNKMDNIEPIKYRYQVITDPIEFEERLYTTIEDNVSRRYKYKFVENVLDKRTEIGNKVDYTDENGKVTNKQSVADFNVNSPAAIIRRETFIDISGIPDLLSYIYEETSSHGTDGLPVPSIEVDFYFSKGGMGSSSVVMFNGTSQNNNNFSGVGMNSYSDNNFVIGGNILPGSTSVTVKYINSKGEILKENRFGNVFPNSTYMPDVISTINDQEGKEWVLDDKSIKPFILTSDHSKNVIELRYIEKYSRITVSFVNREGKKLIDDKSEIVQVGSTYDFSKNLTCTDKAGEIWKFVYSRPSKIIVHDGEDRNRITLVYDIEKTDVIVRYINTDGIPLMEDKILSIAVDKLYTPEIPERVIDANGLGWNHVEGTISSVYVRKGESNIVPLIYEAAKKKVTIKVTDEKGNLLKDSIIEFAQLGETYKYNFDEEICDYEAKEWILSDNSVNSIVVGDDEKSNVITGVYKPRLAKVNISFVAENGRPIRDSVFEDAQVGSVFASDAKGEIQDNFGKCWRCIDKDKSLLVAPKNDLNKITLQYEKLMAKVTIKYFDIEMNELTEPKYQTLQVGSVYKDVPIKEMTDKTGKKWTIDEEKIPSVVVQKFDEENIVSVYYNKKNAKVMLTFYDAYNNELRKPMEVYSQIGALLENNLYLKITDNKGVRWMMESSEPKNLTVRESDNNFKLIYGEVKAKVLVKHIDVNTQKTFIEDIVTTIKLGGIFVPNIRQIILDKNKWRYKYIGEENISIVTKENEQENIIVLTYEPDTRKVILKYRNENDEKIREDSEKDVQIGKEIKIDPILKFNDNEGLGWEYVSYDSKNKYVEENDNIVISTYKPLMAEVVNKFKTSAGNDVISPKSNMVQVGKKFESLNIELLKDAVGLFWIFDSTSDEEIVVKDGPNEIVNNYKEFIKRVTINLCDMNKKLIAEPILKEAQVGSKFEAQYETEYTDAEEKVWSFNTIDYNSIKVSEKENENVINVMYKKKLIPVKVCFFNDALQQIKVPMMVNEQIGSIYVPNVPEEIIDDKSLGWILSPNNDLKFKVKSVENENSMNINYDKFLVDMFVKFKDEKGNEVIKDNITKQQVGTTFMPTVEEYIIDEQDREWIHHFKAENKIFGRKVEPIVISKDSSKNVIELKYKPSLNKVTIKYLDPLGAEIKTSAVVDAQIGSIYKPEIINRIIGIGNVKWTYNPNSKAEVKVSREASENVVNLAYEEEKAAVIYKYMDEERTELKECKKTLAQIGTKFVPSPENVITTSDERVWEYKGKSMEEVKVSENEDDNIVEVMYVPLKVDVALKFQTLNGNTILPDKTVKGQLGSIFKPVIDETISDNESRVFKFLRCEPENIKVKEIPIGASNEINSFVLTYESLFSEARVIFKDIDGNKLKDDEIKQLQVGTTFAPKPIRYVTDRNGIQWELINDKIDSLRVKEDERLNQITMVYEVAKAEVLIRYKDLDGNIVKESQKLELKIGSDFVPEVEQEYVDSEGKKWTYSRTDPVNLTVASINNVVDVFYQEKRAMTITKIQTTDGKTLKDDVKLKRQIGSRYNPTPSMKVIYDSNNDIWRYAYNSPSEIVVSENMEENVIIQYYTGDERPQKVDENKPYYNAAVEKFVDKDLVASMAKEEEEERLRKEKELEEKRKREELELASAVKFDDPHLQNLERNIKLTNSEKNTINKLNDCNTSIVKLLHEALSYGGNLDEFDLENKLNTIIREEKELVQTGLKDILEDDRTGNKILKIFEAITLSEANDKDFYILQQKKAILFADYFVNKTVTDLEQATYIMDRGKATKGLECINAQLGNMKGRNEELIKVKVILTYEKAMLDNYYRARTVVKDDYFTNDEARNKMSTEVVVMVTNSLPTQAIKLFSRCLNLTLYQQNELNAIMHLLNSMQCNTVLSSISKIPDGKTRKTAQKLYKEIMAN